MNDAPFGFSFATEGMARARLHGKTHGYIPISWRPYIEQIATATTAFLMPVGGLLGVMGYPFACDYCHRPIGVRASCDGCGAPL